MPWLEDISPLAQFTLVQADDVVMVNTLVEGLVDKVRIGCFVVVMVMVIVSVSMSMSVCMSFVVAMAHCCVYRLNGAFVRNKERACMHATCLSHRALFQNARDSLLWL